MTNNVVIPFGRRTNGEPPAPPANDEAATELVPTSATSTLTEDMIDKFILFLQENRSNIRAFMGAVTFASPDDPMPAYNLFSSPMSLADFSLGVRILDNAANSMLLRGP